jgi:two-component system response regulator NreC
VWPFGSPSRSPWTSDDIAGGDRPDFPENPVRRGFRLAIISTVEDAIFGLWLPMAQITIPFPMPRDSDKARACPGGPSIATVWLVGGARIVRKAVEELLKSEGCTVTRAFADEQVLDEALQAEPSPSCDVIVLILTGARPFSSFYRVHEVLSRTENPIPLVVLAGQASRGQVYAALRIGAKAYVNLDAEPEELTKAIRAAARRKVYLAPDVAELLVSDLSTAEQTSAARPPKVELSERETEIVHLLCEGLSSKETARRLHISTKTVENHRYNIYRKCEVDSVAGLMRHAIQQGLVSI